ncbi:MAG: hypothetical protein GPJ33_21530 [Microcystis aeruginosa W11-03]|nr:hypothetical protein [Microcystis aeruginosa W11-03]TRU95071.1 MAG: hypothetical protein EWV73_21275 [Microcystis wesenbergii Mw_QC_B_20070930_S4D]
MLQPNLRSSNEIFINAATQLWKPSQADLDFTGLYLDAANSINVISQASVSSWSSIFNNWQFVQGVNNLSTTYDTFGVNDHALLFTTQQRLGSTALFTP